MASLNILLRDPAYTWVSGRFSVPPAATIIADTGPRTAGNYDLIFSIMVIDGKGGIVVEHRNSANLITVRNLGGCAYANQTDFKLNRYILAVNERIRLITMVGAGGNSTYLGSIGYYRLI